MCWRKRDLADLVCDLQKNIIPLEGFGFPLNIIEDNKTDVIVYKTRSVKNFKLKCIYSFRNKKWKRGGTLFLPFFNSQIIITKELAMKSFRTLHHQHSLIFQLNYY